MKKRLCAAALLVLLGISGCGVREEKPTEMMTEPPAVTETAAPTETESVPVWVSPLAVEEFLDLDTSSGEREGTIEYVMVHFTSAVVLDRRDPYNLELNRGIFEDYEIGIHYLIDREGGVHCYLPENRAAWHAGRGEWKGDPQYTDRMNQFSVGIELLGMGTKEEMAAYLTAEEYDLLGPELTGFTDAQYKALKALLADICQRYDLPMDRDHIIGHSEYSAGKSDPGQLFSWEKVLP